MIKLDRKTLPIIRTDTEQDTIERSTYLHALLEKPSNIVYFETDKRLYGMVSFGDVERAGQHGCTDIPINHHFTYLGQQDYMKARQIFRQNNVMAEIPVVENGRLAAEFNKYDSLLLLTRMRDWKHNSYTRQFWKDTGRVALVRPGSGREVKNRIYEKWCQELTKYGADYTCLDLPDLAGRERDFQFILFVDETELRGAKIFVEHFDHCLFDYGTCRTFQDMCTRMGGAVEIDYGEIIDDYKKKGVRVLTLSMRDPRTEYARRIADECRQRYPHAQGELVNQMMRQYDQEFFDDLYTPEFADAIESEGFEAENTRFAVRIKDKKTRYVNITCGERLTVDQPEDYTRTVYFFGQCLIMGSCVSDEHTLESYLQRMINEKGYKVRVVNYGCWGGNLTDYGRMVSSMIREGDIIVWFPEKYNITGKNTLDLWEVLEENNIPSKWLLDNPSHCNHHVMRCLAQAVFDRLFGQDYHDQSEMKPIIRRKKDAIQLFYGDKYFHGWERSGDRRLCGIVINGNPFTSGHLHLVRTASETMDEVILFSVQEESGDFTYAERYAMIYDAAKQFPNVTVVPSGLFLGNGMLFPAYFVKAFVHSAKEQAKLEVESFIEIAHMLGIKYRIAGREPHDAVTDEINRYMLELMPGEGIEPIIIDRYEVGGKQVTGTFVRELIGKDPKELAQYVPETTVQMIIAPDVYKGC